MEYLVCFYQDGEATIYPGDGTNGDVIKFKKNDIIKVSEKDMFKWLEHSHHNNIKLAIYTANMVCDLS